MKRLSAVLLMNDISGAVTRNLASESGIQLDAVVVSDLQSLHNAFAVPRDLLLSFGTGVIVPSQILEIPGLLALNVHSASPQYPGRDPHHFAVYDGAKEYGATLHFMTNKVDAGTIVDVELFEINASATPSDLLEKANRASLVLLARFFNHFSEHSALMQNPGVEWGKRKTTREMFRQLCCISPEFSKEEVDRRVKATTIPGYQNLFIDLHGYRFRIEGPLE